MVKVHLKTPCIIHTYHDDVSETVTSIIDTTQHVESAYCSEIFTMPPLDHKNKAQQFKVILFNQQMSVNKAHTKHTPWGTAVPGRPIQWCPGCRLWISFGGCWGQGSGSGLPSSGWCAWCCCHCGPSWRGGAGGRYPGGWWLRWCLPGYQPSAPTAKLYPAREERMTVKKIYEYICEKCVFLFVNSQKWPQLLMGNVFTFIKQR